MRQILIAEAEAGSFGLPWKRDSTCFNFKFPKEVVHPDDIDKIAGSSDIDALVIGCDLSDYSFISDMINLTHLYIYSGENITDLSFIENLIHLRQLYVVGTHITSVEPLTKLTAEKSRLLAAAREKDNSPKNRLKTSLDYAFDAVCLESDSFDCAPKDLAEDNVLRTDEIIVNGKRMRHR